MAPFVCSTFVPVSKCFCTSKLLRCIQALQYTALNAACRTTMERAGAIESIARVLGVHLARARADDGRKQLLLRHVAQSFSKAIFKISQFTCCTSTKVQVLTHWSAARLTSGAMACSTLRSSRRGMLLMASATRVRYPKLLAYAALVYQRMRS